MNPPGVIVAGDYALATGADLHLPFLARTLAADAMPSAIGWAWFVPADPVAIAAAFQEAWQRPQSVFCFGGLGMHSDDHVRASLAALQAGRDGMGLPRYPEQSDQDSFSCGNVVCFSGRPSLGHPAFLRWWQRHRASDVSSEGSALCAERVRWTVPETAAQAEARALVRRAHPLVMQRLVPANSITATNAGAVMLALTGPSRGKTQAARKALQLALSAAPAAPATPATPASIGNAPGR